MRMLVHFVHVVVLPLYLSLCIRLPGQNVDKNTLTTLGIKTLGWQDEGNANFSVSQVQVHHNYSKVSVQSQQAGSFSQSSQTSSTQNKLQSSSSSRGQNQNTQDFYQSQISGFGQNPVDEDEYFDLTSQSRELGRESQQIGSFSQSQQGGSFAQTSFKRQQKDDFDLEEFSQFRDIEDDQLLTQSSQLQSNVNQNQQPFYPTNINQESGVYVQNGFVSQNQNALTSAFEGQMEDDYDELSVASLSTTKTYNAHGYGSTPQLDDIMKAESYLPSQQQFEDFPDYDLSQLQLVDQKAESTNVDQEESQAKNFYTLNKPIYIHGYKYPPNPRDIYPLNKQTPPAPFEIHAKCPKMATGQFVYSESCNQFLNCWKGRGFVQNCAPGTLFNPKTLECDFASKVQCITGPREPELKQHATSQKIEISCPAEFAGVVPHHSDCSKFINCANGVEYIMDCPPGTLFSLKTNNCDFPYKAECASWSIYFGNIANYSLQSGSSGKLNYDASGGNYQGRDHFNGYGQGSYHQSGDHKHDHKYISSDDFRFHQGSRTNSNANQGVGIYDSGSQGSSSTPSAVEGGHHWLQQTSQKPIPGFYIVHESPNQYPPQSSHEQHQQSGHNIYGTSSQHVGSTQTGFRDHQGLVTDSQGAHSEKSNAQKSLYGQDLNIYGQNEQVGGQNRYLQGTINLHSQNQKTYEQNQVFSGGQNQYLGGSKNFQGEGQTYEQNQKIFESQGQYLHGSQSHYLHGSQGLSGQNQNHYESNQELLGSQGQYPHGNQNIHSPKPNYHKQNQENQGQYLYGSQESYSQTRHLYEQGTNKKHNEGVGYSTSKYTAVGKPRCLEGTTGLFLHPSDCSKFLNCASGQTFVQDCGPGTLFNPDSKVCDFPYRVKCHQSEDYSKLINVRTEPESSVNQQYRQGQGAGAHGYYASQGTTDQNFAASRWQIEQGVDGSRNKGQNQHYGAQGQTSSDIYRETLDHSGSLSSSQDYRSTESSQKSTILGSEGVVKCPQHASGLYPHPTICSKFLNCASGQTFIQDCGPGTVFNPISKICDFPYNVECGGNYGEGLINVKTIPVINNTLDSQSQQNNFEFDNKNQQQGMYGQNQIGESTAIGKTQRGFYGQGQTTGSNQQEDVFGQNENIGSTQQGFYGEGQAPKWSVEGQDQQQSLYGQNQNTLTGSTAKDQQAFYGQSSRPIVNKQQQGSYDQNRIGSSSSAAGQDSYDRSFIVTQQGSTSTTSQQGFYDQKQNTGSTWVNKHQGGFYGQGKTNNEGQNVQETKSYNQQFHGSGLSQGQNTDRQHQQWQTQTRTEVKLQHSPAPFPSTDLNADYEFGSEGGGLEVGALDSKPKVPKLYPKRKDFCESLDFRCSVDDCIPQSMVCDGTKDCPDGVDEQKCEKYVEEFVLTPNTILAVREKERFLNISLVYCAKSCLESKGYKCKSFSYRKDDGACFLSDTNVGHSGALIVSHPYNYYELKAFTVNCTNLYKCPSQKCINFKQVCDGINDCGDRTDEKGCSAEAFGYEIRLGGTDKKHEGRIEIKAFGRWGYVCDDKFGLRDADVACRELGFPLGSLEVKANSYYAQDLHEKEVFYLMDDVTCLGNETTIRDCDFNGWGVNNCEPQEVVGIVCKTPLENCPKDYWKCDSAQECIPLNFVCDDVFDCTDQSDEANQHCEAPIELRLADGKSRYEGRVEIRYHGIWGTVCDDDFNDDSAKVVCKHLGFPGKAVAKKDGFFGAGDGPIWLDQVFCQGNESALEHCVHWNWGEHNCEHAEDVGVICNNTYDSTAHERSVRLDQRSRIDDALPGYLFPERCGLRKDDQFLEDDDVHFRVIKGSGANKGAYPWQASLRIKSKLKPIHWCGAVVISQKFVLTAAHCLAGFAKGAYFVVAGDYNTDDDEGTEQEAYIEEFYIHEEFRSGQKMNNDIALIKLKGEGLVFTKDVQPICLPEADLEYPKGLNCTISGFGSIESGKSGYSHQLRAGWVPLQSREICRMPHVYGSTITEGMICAGSLDEGVDACDGDSGGPLACLHDGLFTLYGLTSWGHHCGYANKPGVYVKVSHYRKWIDETMKKLS